MKGRELLKGSVVRFVVITAGARIRRKKGPRKGWCKLRVRCLGGGVASLGLIGSGLGLFSEPTLQHSQSPETRKLPHGVGAFRAWVGAGA